MMMYMYMMFLFMFLVGLYSFFMKSSFLLSMLISLEFLSVVIFVLLYLLVWGSNESYLLMFYLTFCVCEGSFGLSILVSLVRSKGSDYLQSLSFLKC
uniref:NADH-ubiquinone oxidoreductase chain 4L n=1 Tax=Lachesilla anna TaxID=239245 RepID=A0A343QCH0_9NEOP|nr:NADH dehydrogenase subunit 4L [Lachesilla anna]ATU07117.1 NADH dehydrogenase subunit 4L [Lachesilla anna]